MKTPFLPLIDKINGNVVVLAGLLNNIYFHWLFDILPRIYLLKLGQINFDEIDYFVVDNRTTFEQETLAKIGIPQDKILPLSFPTHIQATNLIVPSFPGTIAWMPSWTCDYLKSIFLDDTGIPKSKTKRLYISRNKSSNRRLINEEKITNFLSKYGFVILNLETLTVAKQAEILAQAEIVISVHSSGLSNIVFCPPQTKIIEIFSPHYVYPCYWLVSNLTHLDYYYLTGEIIGSEHFNQLLYPNHRFEDIYLYINKLIKLLQTIKIL